MMRITIALRALVTGFRAPIGENPITIIIVWQRKGTIINKNCMFSETEYNDEEIPDEGGDLFKFEKNPSIKKAWMGGARSEIKYDQNAVVSERPATKAEMENRKPFEKRIEMKTMEN